MLEEKFKKVSKKVVNKFIDGKGDYSFNKLSTSYNTEDGKNTITVSEFATAEAAKYDITETNFKGNNITKTVIAVATELLNGIIFRNGDSITRDLEKYRIVGISTDQYGALTIFEVTNIVN